MCMTTRIDREARKKVRKEQIGCGGYENTRQTHWQRSPNVIQFSRREIHPGGSSLSLSRWLGAALGKRATLRRRLVAHVFLEL
jgi:hypothetical protein